ncbi:MAG: hypothetical protein Aurels2KO_38520 [Aureliella sp.]
MNRLVRSSMRPSEAPRAGALYIAVLGASLIVAMLSLSVIHGVRINLRRATSKPARVKASMIADAAIEHALATINADSEWRTNYLAGISYPGAPGMLSGGSFTWKLIDSDGNLADNSADSVVVQATATLGNVRHVTEVTLQPTEVGITAMESAMHCADNIYLGLTADISTNSFVSSDANIAALVGSINGSAEASGAISGFIAGSQTSGVPTRQMPDSTVFEYYIKMGTRIDLSLLAHNDHFDLEEMVLSPNNNPWGPTNPEGIYIIDCANQEIRVRELRVFGTLVLLNPGPGSRIEKEVLFEPAISNFPSLLVDGSIEIKFDSNERLEEVDANLNPPGTPYEGNENFDHKDNYPSVIRGLVYVSGNLNFVADAKDSDFEGVVICGSIAANSDCSFDYQSWYMQYPPPGFGAGSQMQVIPGSWRRAESP